MFAKFVCRLEDFPLADITAPVVIVSPFPCQYNGCSGVLGVNILKERVYVTLLAAGFVFIVRPIVDYHF